MAHFFRILVRLCELLRRGVSCRAKNFVNQFVYAN